MTQDLFQDKLSGSNKKPNSSRMTLLVVNLVLILAVPVLSYMLVKDWRLLKTLETELSMVQRQANDYVVLQSSINKYKGYHSELKSLMAEADSAQLGKNYWVERKLEINKRQINRNEASGFLNGSGRSSDAFFKTTMFDLSTIQVGDDLFKFREGDSSDVQLTMKGTFYTKIKSEGS